MQTKLIHTLALVLIATSLSAQQKSNDKIADEHFIKGNYERALTLYQRLYDGAPANATYTYRLGVCFLMTASDRAKAIPYLQKAVKMRESSINVVGGISELVYFDLGSAFRYDNQLDSAKHYLEKYLSNSIGARKNEECKQMLRQIENAKKLMANPINVTFINMGPDVNSVQDDFAPYVTANNQWMFFNSKRILSKTEDRYINNVFLSSFKKNEWKKAERAKTVNSQEDNYLVGKGANDNCLLVKPQRYLSLTDVVDEIVFVDLKGGNIGAKPIIMSEPINTKDIQNGITVSVTGDTIIFASDRKGLGGLGGLDLYMSIKLPNNTWGVPINLNKINTPYDDDYPVLSRDGKTLWFASQGHNSIGGLDIFEATWDNKEQTWTNPRNLGYPINNFYDNHTIAFAQNKRYAYVADVRSEGLGGYDIYQVVFNSEEKNMYLITGKIFSGTKENKINLSESDEIKISIYNQWDKETVGEYQYDYKKNYFFATLTDGDWALKVESPKYETIVHYFKVHDRHADEDIDIGEFYLRDKHK